MISRRKVIKNVLWGSGTLITLPFWMQACGLSGDNTHLSSFSGEEMEMLAAITDTIIPPGNAVGALSVGVDIFLQKLIDDCYENPVRDNVTKQMKVLQQAANKEHGKNFAACDPLQRQQLLLKFSSSREKAENDFFTLMKSETIRGFSTSQKVMEEYLHYHVAPGHYYGCINLNS